MNANQDRHSDTQRFYHENWPEERMDNEITQGRSCCFCTWAWFLSEADWLLCLNPDSPYCYETLDILFSCPVQEQRDPR